MLIQDLRPGARTDLALHRFGASILELPDCLAVRTPANPSFYWGNYLMLPQAPADADLAHWLNRFEELIARPQPASRHVAIGINTVYAGQQLPAWELAGFEMFVNSVMRLAPGQLCAPSRTARGDVLVRPIDFATEVPAIVELECADTHGFGEAGYREYRERQFVRYAQMHEQGCAQWFGLWCDGQLAADSGLMRMAARPGETVRFQRVATHPAWRRRGLASALVHAVSAYALSAWQGSEAIMIADPDDVATRPALLDERVQLNAAGQVELKLKTPWRDGTTHLVMSPLEFMQRLAALVPRPRLHLIRFHGVLAPNAKLRPLVVPQGPPAQEESVTEAAVTAGCEVEPVHARPNRIGWARLLKRVFDIDMQRCPNCGGGELKIIAAILERPVIEKILTHLGLDPQPPPNGRAREVGQD